MLIVSDNARTVWNSLKGLICVYKPADITCNNVRKTIIANLCKELCELKCRPAIPYVQIEGDPIKGDKLTVKVHSSYADLPSVIGPRYQPKDIRCTWMTFLGRQTSGVLCINDGTSLVQRISEAKPLRAYRVTGVLGEATDNYFHDGRVQEKSTFHHVKRHHLDRFLSTIQAAHQKQMFELCGVDIKSQAAYELTTKGLLRPSNSKTPLIYGVKCVHFDLPHFSIEVQCVNEYEMYLKTLIHDIGMQLHTTAHCTSIQCIRHSYFTVQDALLRKHWTLQYILDNLKICQTQTHHFMKQQQQSGLLHQL